MDVSQGAAWDTVVLGAHSTQDVCPTITLHTSFYTLSNMASSMLFQGLRDSRTGATPDMDVHEESLHWLLLLCSKGH